MSFDPTFWVIHLQQAGYFFIQPFSVFDETSFHTAAKFTFEVTRATHGCKNGGLHFDVPHAGLIRFPQILQFFLVGEGAQSPVEPSLT